MTRVPKWNPFLCPSLLTRASLLIILDMPEDQLEASGELSEGIRPTKKKPNPWLIGLKVFLILVAVFAITVCSMMLYVRVKYPNPCFVKGMSMYPTFNSDATRDGTIIRYDEGDQLAGDIVDYGFVDQSETGKASISRFDIVVTYYGEDYDETGSLRTDASGSVSVFPKIKRVVGLPGETVTLKYPKGTSLEDMPPMGYLYVTAANESEPTLVEQPLTKADYLAPLRKIEGGESMTYPEEGSYYSASGVNNEDTKYENTWVLGEDEYAVLGDNRAGNNSRDSRSVGAIKSSYISAKIIKMVGCCKISDDGKSCSLLFNTIKWDKIF